MIQFSLISLIPGLIRSLQDCADPAFDSYEKNLTQATSLKTSERNSREQLQRVISKASDLQLIRGPVLAYMGLPLQIFGKVHLTSSDCKISIAKLDLGQLFWTIYAFTAT